MKRTWMVFAAAAATLVGCAVPDEGEPGGTAQPTQANKPSVASTKANPATVESKDPYWQRASVEVYRSVDELKAQDEREKRRGGTLRKMARGNATLPEIALTFDDGPHPAYTPKLLAVLKQSGVKATFFVIGKMAEKHPELVQAIAADGHLVANHTFSHVTLTKLPVGMIETEYKANNDLIAKITGQQMRFCRPPGGDYDAEVINAAEKMGLTTVLWSDDPGDYASPGTDVITQRTEMNLSNGAIVLLHDGINQTIDVLPKLLADAKARGFSFVTVDKMAERLTEKGEKKRGR